jgi:hypothetical protein
MAVRGRVFPTGWSRVRRFWLGTGMLGLALLVAGTAVLAWPRGGASGSGLTEPATATVGSDRAAAPPAAPSPDIAADGGGAAEAGVPDVATAPVQVPDAPPGSGPRALVRTALLTLSVNDAAAGTRQVRTTAAAAGGQVVQEQSSEQGSWLVLRVPADALDRVIDDLAAIGKVTARSGQVVDSTGEMVDLDARVASQQASVDRVRTLLAQATSIGDVVAVESELARREADLDALKSRLAVLRDQVAMSTLTVDLQGPGGVPAPVDDRAVGFTDGLDAGWSGLLALGSATAAVVGFLLPFLPVLAVLLGIGWAARRLVRNRRVPATGTGGPSGTGSVGES